MPMQRFRGGDGEAGDGHTHPNLNVLNGINVDSFGQLYFDTGYNLNDLKAGSILCLLGSNTDTSGYGNNAVNSGANYPIQVSGLDNQPCLNFAYTNSQLRCANLQANLIGSSGATVYAVFQPQAGEFSLCEHTSQNQLDPFWRYGGDGNGYMGLFRTIRVNGYPTTISMSWQCWSIHSRSSDYEILINKNSQGVRVPGVNGVTGSYWQGNDFYISPNWRSFLGNLALLIVIPYWVDKSSAFHQAKMVAIEGRFPSLPFN